MYLNKKILALLFGVFLFCSNSALALSCIKTKEISVIEFVFSSDAIFIGERIYDGNGADHFKVLKRFKGLSSKTNQVSAYPGSSIIGPVDFRRIPSEENKFLVSVVETDDGSYTQTGFPLCSYTPSTEKIISFLEGSYKYRYLILALIIFLSFSVYKVGGIKKFITMDIREIFKKTFRSK